VLEIIDQCLGHYSGQRVGGGVASFTLGNPEASLQSRRFGGATRFWRRDSHIAMGADSLDAGLMSRTPGEY